MHERHMLDAVLQTLGVKYVQLEFADLEVIEQLQNSILL
jgi:hypothetical protein